MNIANHVILEEPYWNPFVEQQAIDRAHRIGQKKPVSVHRLLVKDTVEQRIIKLQEKKRTMVDIALGTGDNSELQQQREKFGALTKEDVFDLLKPSVDLPDGVMKDDVKDNLRLFSSPKNASRNSSTTSRGDGPARKPSTMMGRGSSRFPGRAPGAAPPGLRRPASSVPPRGPTSVPARDQSGARPRIESNNSTKVSYKSPAESSAKSPGDGPTDWRKLLAKHGGPGRRRF